MQKQKISDQEICEKWSLMVKEVEKVELTDKGAKSKLEQLKSDATLSNILTPRQKDGIYGRCDFKLGQLSTTN